MTRAEIVSVLAFIFALLGPWVTNAMNAQTHAQIVGAYLHLAFMVAATIVVAWVFWRDDTLGNTAAFAWVVVSLIVLVAGACWIEQSRRAIPAITFKASIEKPGDRDGRFAFIIEARSRALVREARMYPVSITIDGKPVIVVHRSMGWYGHEKSFEPTEVGAAGARFILFHGESGNTALEYFTWKEMPDVMKRNLWRAGRGRYEITFELIGQNLPQPAKSTAVLEWDGDLSKAKFYLKDEP